MGLLTPKQWTRLPEDLIEVASCKRIALNNNGLRANGPESRFSADLVLVELSVAVHGSASPGMVCVCLVEAR